MFIWTHIYDLLGKLLTLVLIILLALAFPAIADNTLVFFTLAAVLYFLSYHYGIRTLATWCYCTFSLKMKLSMQQAATLNNAFTPTFGNPLKWLPQRELRDMEGVDKYALALSNFTIWEAEQKAERQKHLQQFKSASKLSKTTTILQLIVLAYLFIASILNWPPADVFTDIFCWLFDTTSYYPMLNFAILALAVVFLFLEIEKRLKR